MPELPDIAAYVAALEARIGGERLAGIRIRGVSVLKTWDPPLAEAEGRLVLNVGRIGKRIVVAFEDDLYLVLHLMVAGRLHWRAPGAPIPGRIGLAAFDFDSGTLTLTEAGARKRASIHLERGGQLGAHSRGGVDVAAVSTAEFGARLTEERHTLKRSLTDPRIFDGIGGAYADEILHRARLSPLAMSDALTESQVSELHRAAISVLDEWTRRLVAEAMESFPEKVTAFRPGMAVHGKFGEPCPVCAAPVQRIVYASNETNYCPRCQTGGRILADRALSRLLKEDWPRSLDDL